MMNCQSQWGRTLLLSSLTSCLKALLDCFLDFPLPNVTENNPVDFGWIHKQQNIGNELATKAIKYQIVTPTLECRKQSKLSSPTKGLYAITPVKTNGTI